ncbi:hypothetical protein Hanom_Chr00s020785g01759901 [Helianthus anomalus]
MLVGYHAMLTGERNMELKDCNCYVNLMLDCGAFGANTQLSTFTRFRFMLLMMNESKILFCHMMLNCV